MKHCSVIHTYLESNIELKKSDLVIPALLLHYVASHILYFKIISHFFTKYEIPLNIMFVFNVKLLFQWVFTDKLRNFKYSRNLNHKKISIIYTFSKKEKWEISCCHNFLFSLVLIRQADYMSPFF